MKTLIITIIIMLMSAFGIHSYDLVQEEKLGADLQVATHLQMKADKADLLGSKLYPGGKVKYAYNSKTKITTTPLAPTAEHAQKAGITLTEDIKKRTSNSRTFKTDRKIDDEDTYVAEIITGDPQMVKDPDTGEWFEVLYATTTEEVYDDAFKVSFWGKVKGLFGQKVLATITDPIYPDAGTGNTTVDGFVLEDGENKTWSDLVDDPGDWADDTSQNVWIARFAASATASQWKNIYRGIFTLPTGDAIPAGATIVSSTFSVYGVGELDNLSTSPDINIYSASPASNNALVEGDYATLGTSAYSDTAHTIASWNTGGYNHWTLNETGRAAIQTGAGNITGIGTRSASHDAADSAPNWVSNQASGFQAETAFSTRANDPMLVVEYTEAAAAGGGAEMLMGMTF